MKFSKTKLTEWALESGTAVDTDEDKDEVEEVQVIDDEEEEKEDERVEEGNETEKGLENDNNY